MLSGYGPFLLQLGSKLAHRILQILKVVQSASQANQSEILGANLVATDFAQLQSA
jgi:hypothetical protein